MASWLDTLLDRGNEAKRTAQPAASERLPAAPRQPEPEINQVWFQTHAPIPERGDPGAVQAAFYSVADGLLRMHDANGKPTGKVQQLAPDEDARRVAGRLGHAAWTATKGQSAFNRPLSYPRSGVA